MIGIVKTAKRRLQNISFSGVDGQVCAFFDTIDPSSNPPFAKLFFSLLKCHIASERHLFSIKMKEIIKKYRAVQDCGIFEYSLINGERRQVDR